MKAKKTRVRPDPPGPPALLRGSGTKNYVAKFTNPTTLANSQIFDNGTNVGVGTVNPMDKFDVRGNIKLGSNAEFFGLGGIENLLLVRGMVNTDGTSFAQPGFSVAKAGTGQYVVTLTTSPDLLEARSGSPFLRPRLTAQEPCRTVVSFSSPRSADSAVHGRKVWSSFAAANILFETHAP